MFEVPDHLLMPVNELGQGPVDPGEETPAAWVCWCGTPGCDKYK